MSRLVEAKVELCMAIEQRDAANLEFCAAAHRGDMTGMISFQRQKLQWKNDVSRLVREVGELEAREAGLLADFGPEEEEVSRVSTQK